MSATSALLLKLVLVPALVGLLTLAGRRWGPRIAGWLAGFPVVAGPTLAFITLEQGSAFAAGAAAAALRAVPCTVAFGICYSWAATRFGWPVAATLAMTAFAGTGALTLAAPLPVPAALGFAGIVLWVAPRLYPRADGPLPAHAPSAWELPTRCLCAAALVVGVTWLADRMGSTLSGLMAVFPVLGLVLGIFSQRAWGPAGVTRLFAAMVRGLYAFAAFCAGLALLLPAMHGALAFLAAMGIALAVQAVAFRMRAL